MAFQTSRHRILSTLTAGLFPRVRNGFRFLVPVAVSLLFAVVLTAQSVRWSPASGTLAKDQETQLSLVFENCEPVNGSVPLPGVTGLEFGSPQVSRSSSFSNVNGRFENRSTTTYHYAVKVGSAEKVTIPAFTVETSRGKLTVPVAAFAVGSATVGRGNSVKLENAANSQITVPEKNVWAGEVFPLTYSLAVDTAFSPQLGSAPRWENPPLAVEDFSGEPTQRSESRNGANFAILDYPTRAMAVSEGLVELPSVKQLIRLASGREREDIFSFSFGPSRSSFDITSAPARINVKPLPKPAPQNFSGAVGRFTFTAKAVPEKVAVGDPVTWTLELAGTGNWPSLNALPARDVSRDFRVVLQPRAQKTQSGGKLFEGTLSEDVVLMPSRPGHYTLGPVKVSVFNPGTGAYETLSAPAVTVEVTPAANGAPAPFAPPPPAGASVSAPPAESPSAPRTLAPPASVPAKIPLEPLPPAAASPAPVDAASLFPWLLAAGLWPLLLWVALAWRRARVTDPLRVRREARKQLEKILRGLAGVQLLPDSGAESLASGNQPPPPLTRLLLEWQRATAAFWGVATAAPCAGQLPEARWVALWEEADRVLYRPAALLPEGWIDEAKAALGSARLPWFAPWRLLLGRNLFPFFFALALALTAQFQATAAETPPEAAYARADFKTAETGWRKRLDADPADWSARHNLALALAQQDRWGESAAQSVAAFLRQPAHPAVRWQLRLALEKAAYTPPPLTLFLAEGPRGTLASLAAPGIWQCALIAAVFIAALGAALALAGAYRARKWVVWSGVGFFIAGTAAASLAFVALRAYGTLADTRAAVVWKASTLYSVPTEADGTQKTTPVVAGAVVLVEKEYLGWRRVTFANKQIGWLRADNIELLWR
ncbi:MAG: BatD family protein [Puniceicoccales bacterium]|nr:BatD family protein [Puniceicoccales bacterium]